MIQLTNDDILNKVLGGHNCRCYTDVGKSTQRYTAQHVFSEWRPVLCCNACCGTSTSSNLGWVFSDQGGDIRACSG